MYYKNADQQQLKIFSDKKRLMWKKINFVIIIICYYRNIIDPIKRGV